MDTTLLIPICLAASIVLMAWPATLWLMADQSRDKKKLSERLSGEMRDDQNDSRTRSILLQSEIEGLPPALVRFASMRKLNIRLKQAFPQVSVTMFLTICFGCGALAMVAALSITLSPFILGLAFIAAFNLPFLVLWRKRIGRQRLLATQLPEALDFLSRILKAGHSLTTGLQMMSEELPMPLAGEFRRSYDQHSLGQSLDDALKETATRIESTDFAFFVTAVLIQRSTGGDLSEVLKNISHMIRGRVRLQQQVKAKTSEGRFTGYVLVCFPAVMYLISYYLSPASASKLLHGKGLVLLGIAIGMQILGLISIKKITTIRI